MTHTNGKTPLRLQSDKLVLEDVRDELMIYDSDRNKAFCLNQTAAFVWKHADGNTTVAEIAQQMGQQMNEPVNEHLVWFALDVLSKDGLLAPAITVPPAVSGLTRRDMLQKIGVGAMAIPMVTALFVSPAKAHASSTVPNPPTGEQNTASPNQGGGGFWKWLENLF
jgi:Coenzyme PQQ synthesis protein D (PqqD)